MQNEKVHENGSIHVGSNIFCATFASAESGVIARAKKDVNPLTGGSAMTVVGILGFDDEDPYILRFVLEYDKQIKGSAFWTSKANSIAAQMNDIGITVADMDEFGYVKLVTLDIREVKKITGSIAAPIDVFLGSESPISGYPNYQQITIRERKNILADERKKYLESTPLEMKLFDWSNKKSERVVYTNPLERKYSR